MADWPPFSGLRSETFNVATGTPGVFNTVTSSATANAKGPWTQLSAATGFEATAMLLHINTSFNDTRYLIDIGIGAAGSEQVIVPNLQVGIPTGIAVSVLLPLNIPAGVRLAARSQDNFGSSGSSISGTLYAGGWATGPSFSSMTDYGANTATSGGTTVDAGAAANTKGAYSQLVAATTYAHKAIMIAAMRPTPATAMASDYAQLADLAVGASGSEQILLPNLRFIAAIASGGATGSPLAYTGRGALNPEIVPPLLCDIPAGSRLAMRQQSSSTNATDRTCSYVVYGLN